MLNKRTVTQQRLEKLMELSKRIIVLYVLPFKRTQQLYEIYS